MVPHMCSGHAVDTSANTLNRSVSFMRHSPDRPVAVIKPGFIRLCSSANDSPLRLCCNTSDMATEQAVEDWPE